MCGLEWGKLFVDVLKSVFWPGAFVWAAWYYRVDIKALAVRVTELGMTKVVLTPTQQTMPAPASPSAPLPAPLETTSEIPSDIASPTVKQSIAQIRSAISPDQLDPQIAMMRSHLPPDIANDPKDTIDFLVHALASLSVQLGHERTYRQIYGTQLQLLLSLNTPSGLDKAAILSAYTEAAKLFPSVYPDPTTFDHWIGFLLTGGLIVAHPNGRYELTPVGRGLLRYIVDAKLPAYKPY